MLTCKGNVFLSNIRMLIHMCQMHGLYKIAGVNTMNSSELIIVIFFLEVATDACIFKLPTQVVAS